jgi:oligosaccharide repeat unit polymerase
MLRIVVVLVVVLAGFSVTRAVVGRTSTLDTVDYVASYFGGGIRAFDLYLQDPVPPSDLWGKESFNSFNRILYQVGIYDVSYPAPLEFRTVNGIPVGNVYTAFRELYHDFSVAGLVFFQMLFGFVITRMYQFVKRRKKASRVSPLAILFCLILHAVYLQPFMNVFYTYMMSVNYAFIAAVILVISGAINKTMTRA